MTLDCTASPCTKICQLRAEADFCAGCGRSLGEIGEWSSASDQRKRAILACLPARLARIPAPSTPL